MELVINQNEDFSGSTNNTIHTKFLENNNCEVFDGAFTYKNGIMWIID